MSEKFSKQRNKLIEYLNDEKNITREEDLKRAYNIIQYITDDEYNEIKKLYNGNADGLKELINILEKTGKKPEFLRALIDKEKNRFPSFEDLNQNKICKLFDLIKDDKFGITEIFDNDVEMLDDFLNRLIRVKYGAGKNVGRGELFIMTLFQHTQHEDQGDVIMDGNEIEIKFSKDFSTNGGRLIANKSHTIKTAEQIADYLKDELIKLNIDISGIQLNSHDHIIIGGKEYMDKIFDCLTKSIDEVKICGLLACMYFYQFNNLQDKKEEFDKFIRNNFTKYDFDSLLRIHGCLAVMSYYEEDKWDYMLVGEYSKSNYYLINGNFCKKDNFSKNLEVLINDDNFTFKRYPYTIDTANFAQDNVCQIYVSRKK